MAVTYGFYDSLNHDRLYNAQQMSAIFDGIINDGVFMSVGNQFHTVAGSGMQVVVKSGRAWFDSTWTLNDAEYPLSIDAADVLLTRIDAVVLEVNSEVATRANTIKVVKGTPASTPAKPTLTNTATIHQHALAYVTVAKNITAITNSMIEIVVGKTETPYVTAILKTTDITDLYNQWEDYFQTWFDTVRGTLDGDVALNLQNQITTLRRDTLKNTTPPIIGLSASATPDDMFQALAKTGDLHVWRKTVKNAEDVPAGYTLGEVQNVTKHPITDVRSGGYTIVTKAYSNLSVDVAGNVSVDESSYVNFYDDASAVRGKFIQVYSDSDILFIPNDANISTDYKTVGSANIHNHYTDKYQSVTGYPLTPAGTTTTYPVSTNPNAYQEGDDAKSAGYVVGEVVTGRFKMGLNDTSNGWNYGIEAKPTVNSDGTFKTLTLHLTTSNFINASNLKTAIAGKFVQLIGYNGYSSPPDTSGPFSSVPGPVIFVPTDVNCTVTNSVLIIDRYQPVTGYAAIPAGTTIEYLGKLGDKARVQVVSYVGTGTYGKDHPSSITFDFVPKIAIAITTTHVNQSNENIDSTMVFDTLTTNMHDHYGFSTAPGNYPSYGKKSSDGKTFSWYNTRNAYTQLNESGNKYYILAIG